MDKPYKYSIHDTLKNVWTYQNYAPLLHHLETYVQTENPNIKVKKQTKICYTDVRYKAKLRLYNYLTFTKKGLDLPKYKPFEGTEIGKSIPILNF
jgi:hypothetical protein